VQLSCVVRVAGGRQRSNFRVVAATEEDQRRTVALSTQRADPADADLMIAAVVNSVDRAVKPGENTIEMGSAGGASAPADPAELISTGDGEAMAQFLLVMREYVGAESPEPLDLRPRGRCPCGTEPDQGRLQREREERANRQAYWQLSGPASDDGDAGREMSKYPAEERVRDAIDGTRRSYGQLSRGSHVSMLARLVICFNINVETRP